ncbi:uroporphyrinogen-III synthase [Planosporangium flavigriseum]|uniref:Uroporphyrinogen III methyltransferase n=1 Tax=Planosporangium flavigriseum TaxID=373681 RepID=A0A8J3LL96_9ACTN|nr:uroporphyrinogen-III synthase [Planosporangium flavigriseum]NJC64795.1 uroporphyrinogen-III synthase [Planosporangium flavigriseum]GIG72665.1 uroporphyrinogen III methyltransferase [Planosporangium flavigriseum]
MPDIQPLTGFTVAVPADERRDELVGLLRRRGARVVATPALRVVPLADDTELRRATLACVARPLDAVIATTGTGLRGWLDAAEAWGLADPLRSRLAASYLIVRGPAASIAGLAGSWCPASDGDDEVLDHLLDTGVAGKRIALQLHGQPQPEFGAALRDAGADVVEVPVSRYLPPIDPAPLRRLIDLTTSRLVDAVAVTSAPAVSSLLSAAGTDAETVVDALRTDVLAACLGPLAAAPLRRRQVPVALPPRARLDALVRVLADELPRRSVTLRVAGSPVTLRGYAAVVDGVLRPLAPAPMAVLRALADEPGRVLSRATLLRALPRGADEHAVEMAVARLRAALGRAAYVQTVVKRGYRLRVD